MESYPHLPQLSNGELDLSKLQDAQPMKTKPNREKGYTAGNSCITEVVTESKPTKPLLDPGAFCSFIGKSFLQNFAPNLEDQLLPIYGIRFNTASNLMNALGIFVTTSYFHILRKFKNHYLHNNKDIYFTIGDNKHQKFVFLPFKRQIIVSKVAPISLELERFKSKQLNKAEITFHQTDRQENYLSSLLYDHREAFASAKEPLGAIIGHEADIILNIERPY
ncbi:hypothetical protein O181_055881 [Austropuccinia psidii MF-1]|uniref:Uncharacterized protein n=1 Tax=Austropuccinia psidii MF-1 TaxID=1389203 RepID=A0A9Q3E5B5_9BASI|nr:hypothetical protein [Austropuccinia psidii MF-1]